MYINLNSLEEGLHNIVLENGSADFLQGAR